MKVVDLFQTVDLYEAKNMNVVVDSLFQYARSIGDNPGGVIGSLFAYFFVY
jgi:hypothetical protein